MDATTAATYAVAFIGVSVVLFCGIDTLRYTLENRRLAAQERREVAEAAAELDRLHSTVPYNSNPRYRKNHVSPGVSNTRRRSADDSSSSNTATDYANYSLIGSAGPSSCGSDGSSGSGSGGSDSCSGGD